MNKPVRRVGSVFELKLSAQERELLRSIAPQMREIFDSEDDDVLERLFPVAYPEDNDRETEYRLLVRDELRESHLKALATLEATASAEHLEEDELDTWMRALNEVRLVLGTRLDVSEDDVSRPKDPSDPRTSGYAVYDYLTWLQGEIIAALES